MTEYRVTVHNIDTGKEVDSMDLELDEGDILQLRLLIENPESNTLIEEYGGEDES